MKKKRIGKVIAASLIVVLVAAIFGILKISSIDKYKGLVKVNKASLTSISTKLSANISDLSEDNNIEVKGYDEVDYNISYRLSEVPGERDVIINAKINENDQYATFKEVTGTDITSVLSADRKEITITLKNLPSNEEITSKVTMLIVNAPKGYTVRPSIRIKESTSNEYTTVAVRDVTVNTSSVQGTVIDEEGNRVPNIIIALKKNNQIIKETYTNGDGIYTLSDITPDTYSVVVNEENYEDLELNNLYIEDGNQLNLIVKKVYPYKIETNKYITKVELNNLGSKKDYLYNDVTLANIPVRKVNNLHGKIYYKITVQNTGEKAGIISSVKDELPEGLSFDEKLNSGYELKNGIIYNRNLEGIELGAGEQISDTLVLTIENTDIAKTYINKVNARGELYEHVVYLLDGRTYKTLDVLEGETIDEPTVSAQNFSGWYTDETLTNKYKFELPVEKDLILYGVTAKKHTVKFNDKHPETLVETPYDEKEVDNGKPVTKPDTDPEKEGYDFCGWTKDGVVWDFHTPVTEDLTLVSKYCIKSYKVEFYDKSASNGAEYEKIGDISKEYKSTLSNSEAPDLSNAWVGHNFLRWTTDQAGNTEYSFNTQIKGNIKLYAQYSLQNRSFIFNDENRITEKTVNYGATVTPIDNQGKTGHSFVHWSLEVNGQTPFDFSTPIYQTTTVYAVYQINQYHVIFNDTDPWTNVTEQYDDQIVNHGGNAIEPAEPQKEGHTFCGWKLNGNDYNFSTQVTDNITLDSCYTKNKVTVTFMDGDQIFTTQDVDYGDYANDTTTHPSKEHNIFTYWTEDGQTPFDFANTQIKTPKTLYSTYEEVIAPTISHTPLYWTNDKVLVTISSTNPNYTFVYKVDNGIYQDYTEPFELDTNSTIVAKSIYGDAESVIATHEVTNIDKLNPVIGTLTTTPSFNSIVIAGPLTDNQSGIKSISIYNGNDLVGTVNGTAVNIDLRDYTKEKSLNYVVSGLTQSTEYTFRIVVTDGAGNVTETTITETTTQPEIICQIISVNGVDLEEENYIEFPLLASAIADTHCDSKCTIQMLKNTNESVSILNTQDITLDLNGKTVAGILPGYTVDNQGTFTLVDHADTTGGIINGSGIAIFNNANAKFIMGEGSSDPETTGAGRMVSTTVPYVFGETYGVYTENGAEFAFFDGKIKGTNAVQGEVTETEYSYNATSSDVESYEEVTLAQLIEPEARRNKSIYYGNVANAVTEAKQGTSTITNTPDTLLAGFTHVDEVNPLNAYWDAESGYPFIYDETTNTLTSGNLYYGSIAFTNTIIDLTDYEDDQVLELTYNTIPGADGRTGTVFVRIYELDENLIPTSTLNIIYVNGDLRAYRLTKGKQYKVDIRYTQPVGLVKAEFENKSEGGYTLPNYDTLPQSKLVISDATLHKEIRTTDHFNEITPPIKTYGFYYDETTKTIKSNHQYTKSINSSETAFGYMELDLTGKEGDYVVSTTAYVETYSNNYNGAAIMYVTENAPEIYTYSDSGSNLMWLSTNRGTSSYDLEHYVGYDRPYAGLGPYNASRAITGGKKYYLNFAFFKETNSDIPDQSEYEANGVSDQMTITSIRVYKTNGSEDLDLVHDSVGNAFDFDNPFVRSGVNHYSLTHNNTDEYHDSYIKIDLTDSAVDRVLQVDSYMYPYNYLSVYITSNNRGLTIDDIKTSRDKMLLYKDDIYTTGSVNIASYTLSQYNHSLYNNSSENYYLPKGNVYYVHFNVRLGAYYATSFKTDEYDCSETNSGYCGAGLFKGLKLLNVEDSVYYYGNTPINVGTVDYDSLPEDTNTIDSINAAQANVESPFVSGYVWNDELGYYTLEKEIPYYTAAGFTTTFDLRNETSPKTIQASYLWDSTGNLGWNDYYTIDEPAPMIYRNNGNFTRPEESYYISIYSSPYITFEPGHIYYIYHMAYRNSRNPITTDGVRYDEVSGTNTHEYTKGEKIVSFNEDVDEIQILRDIQLQSSMVVDYNKETILDLNGYTITSSLTDNVIDNYGKLTIIDSDYQNQTGDNKLHKGKINSSAGNIIKNEKDAELVIKDCVLEENSTNSSRTAIYNEGKLTFVPEYDSKIYVNAYSAYGIQNQSFGTVSEDVSSLEIIMNYLNQAEQTYRVYSRNSSSRYTTINTGFYNRGYVNLKSLRITGKNGSGFFNEYDGVAVLRQANISVDINAKDKIYTGAINPLNYQYQYTQYSRTYTNSIEDYGVKNKGVITIANGSNIGPRVYSEGDIYVTNGSNLGYLRTTGKTYVNNGSRMSDAEFKGDTVVDSSSVLNRTDNYGNYQLVRTSSGSGTSSEVINNYGSGNFEAHNVGLYNLNNYDNGTMFLNSGNAKHILNEGNSVTLNSFTINNTGTTYSEAIINSGIMNIEYDNTIIDVNGDAIKMIPRTTTNSFSYYPYGGSRTTFTETTYYPVLLNIGTENDTTSTNEIFGKTRGITGNCYQRAERVENVSSISVNMGSYSTIQNADYLDRYYLADFDGNVEPITQENYDQTMCFVNLYTGTIKSTDNPNDASKVLSIPVSNALEDSYSIFSNGLYVYPKQYAIDNNNTANMAKIGDTYYISVKDAIDSITTSDPVTIDVLFYTDVSKVEIPEGKNITLNFVGSKTYLYSNSGAFKNNGTLKLQATGEVLSAGKYAIENNSNLVIDSGTYSNLWDTSYKKESAIVNNKGTATINGGTFNQLDTYNTANLTINDGSFIGAMLYGAGNSSITNVKGGYFNNLNAVSTYLEYRVSNDKFNTNGGWRHLFELNNGATGIIDGLNTDNDSRYDFFRPIAHVNNATLQLKSGKIGYPSAYYPVPYIVAVNHSNVIVDDGEYNNVFFGIKGSHLQINGGSLTSYADSNDGNRLDLIYMYGETPTADITGGNLVSKENVIGLSRFTKDTTDPEEIYSYKINIGIKGDRDNNNDIICSKTSPSLVAEKYPVTKYGTGSGAGFFGFYDGIFKGKTSALDISIDEIEEDYEVISNTEGSYNVKYLDQLDLVKNNTTGEIYQTFQKAFREATIGDELETLRDYTNTTGTAKIVIPDTSNFTLKIKHLITVNNSEFIENNGNAIFEGAGGSFNVPVSSNVFINNANLTLNDVIISNLKATGAKPELIKNNQGAVLNINGSKITTLQHHIISNLGTLNIDKTGTNSCYNSTRFIADYTSGLSSNPVLIYNSSTGIANINYMVMKSAYYTKLIENYGQITINNSVIDQTDTRGRVETGSWDIRDNSGIIESNGTIEIDNSKIVFAPNSVINNYSNIYNDYRFYQNAYFKLEDGSSLILKNNVIETYFIGLIYVNKPWHYSDIPTNITIEDTTYHSQSFGIIANDNVNINLKNNTFNIRDSIIDGEREYDYGRYDNKLTFYDPAESSNHNYKINIEGGTYNIEGYIKPLSGSYSPISMVYSISCENNIMDNVVTTGSVSANDIYFTSSYSTTILNSDTLTLKDTSIYVTPPTSISNDGIYVCLYPRTKVGDTYCDYKYSSNPVASLSPNYIVKEIGAINNFGTINVINSTVTTSNTMPAISVFGNNAVINIGEKDDLNNIDSPIISSGSYNIPIKFYNEKGSVNLYDGRINSNNKIYINNDETDLDSHFTDKENGYIISSTSKLRYLSKEKLIKNITQDISYDNIQEAINAANNNDTLQMLSGTVRINALDDVSISGKNLTLDANCKIIGNRFSLVNGANLTLNSSACDSNDNATEFNISKIDLYDTSTLTTNDGRGLIETHDNSIATVKERASYNVIGRDNSTINAQNNASGIQNIVSGITYDNSILNLSNSNVEAVRSNGESTINNSDSTVSQIYLNDDSNYSDSCTNNSTLVVRRMENDSNSLLNISCGTHWDFRNNKSAKITGGIFTSGSRSYGPLEIVDGSFTNLVIYNSTADIKDGYFENVMVINNSLSSRIEVNISGGTFVSQNTDYGSALMIKADDDCSMENTVVNVSGGTIDLINGYGGSSIINVTGGTINSFTIGSSRSVRGNITGGTFNYIHNKSSSSIINIGLKDGLVSTTSPAITNTTNSGINNEKGTINFYDGIVTGISNRGAIYGRINEVEDNYKIEVVDNGDDTETAYLTVITESDSKIAMVNGINYKSLQQAVNKSVQNCTQGSTCPNIYIYHNIELDANLTITSGYSVNIISNGFSISTNGVTVDPNITVDGQPFLDESLGGNILNSVRGMLGLGESGTSVLVYEMADGSALSSENHYRLYKFDGSDYDLVTMEKGDEVARYNPGKGLTNMKPIKGRLYLTNLDPGDYKVSDDNNSEVTFTINADGTLSGHVKEYVPSNSKIESTGEAKLLISIQTGIRKINYMLIAISLIAVLSVMFVLKRKSQNKNLA